MLSSWDMSILNINCKGIIVLTCWRFKELGRLVQFYHFRFFSARNSLKNYFKLFRVFKTKIYAHRKIEESERNKIITYFNAFTWNIGRKLSFSHCPIYGTRGAKGLIQLIKWIMKLCNNNLMTYIILILIIVNWYKLNLRNDS